MKIVWNKECGEKLFNSFTAKKQACKRRADWIPYVGFNHNCECGCRFFLSLDEVLAQKRTCGICQEEIEIEIDIVDEKFLEFLKTSDQQLNITFNL